MAAESKEFKVWLEGYAATGEHATAQYLGRYFTANFKEAVQSALRANKWDMSYYDEKRNTYWGCQFFDNESDARKQFG